MYPYLARQMSDLGIRQPLRGLNSGVRAEISTCPACLLAILLSLVRRAQQTQRHRDLYWFGPPLWCNTLIQCGVVDCLGGLRMN